MFADETANDAAVWIAAYAIAGIFAIAMIAAAGTAVWLTVRAVRRHTSNRKHPR